MRITDVEALLLRQPEVDASRADGSQDGLLIRVHTDEGIVGIGEVDSFLRRQGDHRRAALPQDRFGAAAPSWSARTRSNRPAMAEDVSRARSTSAGAEP